MLSALSHLIAANWKVILSTVVSLIVLALPSVITALTNYPKIDGALKVLLKILARASTLQHFDSPGTMKMLGTACARPDIDGDPTPVNVPTAIGSVKLPMILIPLLLTMGLSMPGCPASCQTAAVDASQVQAQCPEAKQIESGIFNSTMSTVFTDLISEDFSGLLGQLVSKLIGLGIANAPGLVKCVVAVVDANSAHVPKGASIDPAAAKLHAHAHAYLSGTPDACKAAAHKGDGGHLVDAGIK